MNAGMESLLTRSAAVSPHDNPRERGGPGQPKTLYRNSVGTLESNLGKVGGAPKTSLELFSALNARQTARYPRLLLKSPAAALSQRKPGKLS